MYHFYLFHYYFIIVSLTARAIGMGGSVPFIGVLSAIYVDAEILVTGAQGPGSNAHVVNECLGILSFLLLLLKSIIIILNATFCFDFNRSCIR